jgi:Cu2+-containing amine oxidase
MAEHRVVAPHPLDPLTAEEIRRAAAIPRRDRGVGERWRFASIELREPAKQTVRDFSPGDPIGREARTEAQARQDYDWSTQRAWKVVNESATNSLGTPVGYEPGGQARDSPGLQRAPVIGHTLRVNALP